MTPRGGAAAVTPAGTAAMEDAQKTAVDPKIFIVLGLLVAAALIGSFTTGIIGGGGGDNNPLPDVTPIAGEEGSRSLPSSQTQVTVNVAPPPFTPPTTTGPTTTDAVAPQSKVVVPPDPRQTTGTMGIMVNTPNISPAQALALAKFAKQQFESGGRWTGMQVVVFNNPDAARTFLKYQAQRRGAKLTPNEYQDLANQGVWNSVPAYYETQGKTGTPYYPANSPKGWWARR